jgi:putative transposase
VFVTINGTTHDRWRAVDQHGNVLDILVQSRRTAVAAKRFFRKVRPERGRGLDVGRAC